MQNDKTLNEYNKKINQRWDLFFKVRFMTIKNYLIKHKYQRPNCPKKHGLRKFKCDINGGYCCDLCEKEIDAYSQFYGCRSCDFDLCQKCYISKCDSYVKI